MCSHVAEKPHAVCIPYPAQGHINPMLKLAKLLHFKGFHITFVHTEFNHRRLLKSRGLDSLKGLDDFRFETIPDGLPSSDLDATQDIPALCDSTRKYCLVPFRNLVVKLNGSVHHPPVSCIVSDGSMSFTLQVAEELHIPNREGNGLVACKLRRRSSWGPRGDDSDDWRCGAHLIGGDGGSRWSIGCKKE